MSPSEVGRSRRELFGRGSVYTLASALQAGSLLLVLPLATRLLSPSEFGVVATASVLQQLLGLAAALGLPSVVMLEYFAAPDGIGADRARRLVGATLMGAVVVVTVVDLAGPWWTRLFADLDYGPSLRLAVWSAVPLAVVAACLSVLRSARRAGWYVGVAGLATAGGQLTGLALSAIWSPTAESYLLGVLLGATAGAGLGLVVGGIAIPRGVDLPHVRASLRTALPIVPHSLSMFALLAVDRLVIERTLGLEAAGRYQVAYLIGAAGLSLLAAVNNAWSPLVYGAPDDRRWKTLADTTRDLEACVPAVVAVLALGAPLALGVAAPSAYGPADLARVTALVAAATLPFLWYLASGHVLLFTRQTASLARITPLVAMGAVIAGLLLVPRGGLLTAAAITVGSYAVLAGSVRRRAAALAAVPWDLGSSARATVHVAVIVGAAWILPTSALGSATRAVLVVVTVLTSVSRLRSSTRATLTATPEPRA
jgi:O-antigen/teichoic acid export membrane protein